MRYCPKCGAEYRPDFTECSDCLIPLVDEPPEFDGFDETLFPRLVQVYWVDRFNAEVMRATLEGNRVPAVVAREGYSTAYPLTVGYIGEGRVKVREQDVGRALDVVTAAVAGELKLEGTYEPGLPRPLWFRIAAKVFCSVVLAGEVLGVLPLY